MPVVTGDPLHDAVNFTGMVLLSLKACTGSVKVPQEIPPFPPFAKGGEGEFCRDGLWRGCANVVWSNLVPQEAAPLLLCCHPLVNLATTEPRI